MRCITQDYENYAEPGSENKPGLMEFKDIGAKLGISRCAAMRAYWSGLKKLRQALETKTCRSVHVGRVSGTE
jgi:hypothetical protein